MRILALEPYYGGSHRAFIDGWSAGSRHDWTVLGLPARKWRWRMRHAALTLAEQVSERLRVGQGWDVIFCSDMLNLAEFLGVVPPSVRELPALVYFHENQVTYPVPPGEQRDHHLAFSNIVTAAAATGVSFNSAYHRDGFCDGARDFVKRMPDYAPVTWIDAIRERSAVRPPGVSGTPRSDGPRASGPLHVLWSARWEYDKNPETFFAALDLLQAAGVGFRVSVIGGEGGRQPPPEFAAARQRLGDRVVHWGYQESREGYEDVLRACDVVVSTARHEFFGISVVEAVAAGAFPVVPHRLAYPEVLGAGEAPGKASFFHDGSAESLAAKLMRLAECLGGDGLWEGDSERGLRTVSRYDWSRCAAEYDREIEVLGR